jgi:phage shock protein PspC (stress-responsive transcriptional regulator)
MDDDRTADLPLPDPERPALPTGALMLEAGAQTGATDPGPPGGGNSGGGAPGDGAPRDEGDGGGDGVGPPSPPHRLRRDMEHGMLGGVAAGVARYFDVDVVIVRVAIAALTVLGGSGALIYLAAWVLIPADGNNVALAQQWSERRPPRRNLFLIVVGVVLAVAALSVLIHDGPWFPGRNSGVGFLLGVAAVVVALTLVAGSGGNRTAGSRFRWLFLMMILSVVGILVVAAATVFSIEAASGVPLRGGIGNTQWHPTTVGQLAPNYRLAAGNLNVDLSAVPFRAGTTHVTASVGFGQLRVEVPPGPTVSVVAHSGLGDVRVFGQGNGGLSTVQSLQSSGSGSGARRHIVIDADAGIGRVDVIRAAPEPAFS